MKLKYGIEIALYNIGSIFRALENFCPHKGYPLAASRLYGHIVKCSLHAWRFDVRTGECVTKKSCSIEKYVVAVEKGWIRIEV